MKKLVLLFLSAACVAQQVDASCCTKPQTKTKKQSVTTRKANHKIDDMFVERRSLYAMSGESMTDQELKQLFEAARWAPSSYNGQPWRFLYAKRDTPQWNKLYDLLVDFNKKWTNNASALVLVISRNNFEYNNAANRNHSFDTGAAWQNFALQAHLNGLVAHGMSGFDAERARKELNISDEYTIEMMIAVGKRGVVEDLPADMRSIEDKASDRKSVEEIAFEVPGPFKK